MSGIETAAIVMTVISTAYAAYAQKAAGDFQAAIAKRNADAATAMARDAAARGLNEGVKIGLVGGATRGAIRAGFGASGVELTSGSPLDVLSDAAMFNELDKQTAKSNSEREQYALRTQAGNYLAQGQLDQMKGNYGAVGSLLSGASSLTGDYYRRTPSTTVVKG
jgi:hypothetical protein